MLSSLKKKKSVFMLSVIALLVIVLVLALPAQKPALQSKNSVSTSDGMIPIQAGFNKSAYPIDVASSLWVVVNKGRALPSDYVPANLTVPKVPLRYATSTPEMQMRSDAAAAVEQMFGAAKQAGINLKLASGYRSYANQAATYNGYVNSSNVQQADTFSARPGHSEHQTGLAADLEPVSGQCELDQCFGDLPEGKWLAANAYKFGFIIRYPKDGQSLTGYEYEPWHIRYVGTELAAQINQTGKTLEQFFDLSVYTNYPAQSLILKI